MRAGEPSLGTKVTSLGLQVKPSENGERQPATSTPTSDIFLVTINLSVTEDYRPSKSHLMDLFASHVFLVLSVTVTSNSFPHSLHLT